MDRSIFKAASDGNVYAMLSLAYMYHRGIDVDCDPQKAIEWYKRSAANGCARAKWELAKMYRDGTLVAPNAYEFIHWLSAAADSGIPEAQTNLAIRYGLGILVPEDPYLCMELLNKAVAQGYPMAEFYLGNAYQCGIVFEKDETRAEECFQLVKAHGDADLFNKIGMKLEYGLDGVSVDFKRALRWYRLSSEMGSDKGYYSMISLKKTLKGAKHETIEERRRKLDSLLSSVEERERDELLREADLLLEDGDIVSAMTKYNEAADLGNSDAMYMLAILYHEGEVVKRNDPLAYDYLGRAALSGSIDAQMHLASSYEYGQGRPKDLNLALEYYAMAVANGYLLGYYALSRHMDHPEKYVRAHHKIVR
ncbi:MAG: hypothetical protein MJZ38_06040 [archaeon]|nr:hypothetical protein [archaeon]